ncbi:MAG: hypothetical protein MJZ20_02775 [Bacteroidaceae bacterium]|nr:hypothetical protein [Bacteroidaceae bacterium]
MAIYKGSTLISGASDVGVLGSAHSIGDIFYTTRKDTALAGAVECNGGTYSTADYEGTGSIGELLKAGKLPYVSLTEYANKISTDGVCGVFGWNGGTSTSFRVPLLKDIFIEAAPMSEQQHGWQMAAGLPNITGDVNGVSNSYFYSSPTADGVFYVDSYSNNSFAGGGGIRNNSAKLHFNASRSNSIYGNSTTVQPEAVKYRAMVQLFNGTTDQAVATVGTVVAEVANRVIKGHEVIAFQVPTEENGYTWYRKYADGWVEQGGNAVNQKPATITLPVEMADTNYTLVATGFLESRTNTNGARWSDVSAWITSTTTITMGGTTLGMCWEVKGMAK